MATVPSPEHPTHLLRRSVALRALEHDYLERQGAPCTFTHYAPLEPVNLRTCSSCQAGEHDHCPRWWMRQPSAMASPCRCLCWAATWRDYAEATGQTVDAVLAGRGMARIYAAGVGPSHHLPPAEPANPEPWDVGEVPASPAEPASGPGPVLDLEACTECGHLHYLPELRRYDPCPIPSCSCEPPAELVDPWAEVRALPPTEAWSQEGR